MQHITDVKKSKNILSKSTLCTKIGLLTQCVFVIFFLFCVLSYFKEYFKETKRIDDDSRSAIWRILARICRKKQLKREWYNRHPVTRTFSRGIYKNWGKNMWVDIMMFPSQHFHPFSFSFKNTDFLTTLCEYVISYSRLLRCMRQ